ncbi:MAG: phospholipase D-like domain-containing protein [Rothia sp. (in: high G+C Gram-positive bacteria)]|nr:phospholipase D-like domain-containing protein [Rothia sp. (in: high G+C Gram-positive bacteria)]
MRTFTKLALTGALLAPAVLGAKHACKPLPAGLGVRGQLLPGQVQLLTDLTFYSDGKSETDQQIFTTVEKLIEGAEKFLVLDMFLFNADYDRSSGTHPALSARLTDALLAKRAASPQVPILLITDPINTFYGSKPQPHFDALRQAGVQVVETDLDPLPDSNPFYSAIFRTYLRHLPELPGTLPHPLTPGAGKVSLGSYLRMLNIKANHRKVAMSEREAVVSSANPHDASAPNSNLGLLVRGPVLKDVLASERVVFEMSGGDPGVFDGFTRQLELGTRHDEATGVGAHAAPTAPSEVATQLITEGGIRTQVLELLAAAGAGDRVLLGMFYLSERKVLTALTEAAARGARVEVILDQNMDAFGRRKTGLPAKPVAAELAAAGVKVRWYETHGEQFHPKYLVVFTGKNCDVIAGSGNFTRRNICSYNLETNLRIQTPADSVLAQEIAGLWQLMWNNEGALFTSDYEQHALPGGVGGAVQKLVYRLQEATGLGAF